MPEAVSRQELLTEISHCRQAVDAFLLDADSGANIAPDHLRQTALAYLERGGKRLRPAILLFACEALGGDRWLALPAAAAVELFHVWTLVHDDIIDDDDLRRGAPSGHRVAEALGKRDLSLSRNVAEKYGRDTAILAGDVQQAWSFSSLLQCVGRGASAGVVAALAARMAGQLNPRLIEGEMLDVQFSHIPFADLGEEDILRMEELKTGELLDFSALAGACLGANLAPEDCPEARALGCFARNCGIAFQLQDDILGIVGDEAKLGKPIGSDICEGKRTVIALHTFQQADVAQRARLLEILGKTEATGAEIAEVAGLFDRLGGLARARELAAQALATGMAQLELIPESRSKSLLKAWADFMTTRSF